MKKGIILFFAIFIKSYLMLGQNGEASLGSGTTFILKITEDTTWIAADSRTTYLKRGIPNFDTICKINNYKNIFFGFASLVILIGKRGDTLFNADKMMYTIVSKYNNLDSALKIFNTRILEKFNSLLRMNDPAGLAIKKEYFNKACLDFFIITYRKNKPYYKTATWTIQGKDSTAIAEVDSRMPLATTLFFGFYWEAVEAIKHGEYLKNPSSYAKDLISLIELEAITHPVEVAKPIDIVMLYNKSHKWLSKPIKPISTDFK